MRLFDSHCHLEYKLLNNNVEAVIKRAIASNISMIEVGTLPKESRKAIGLANRFPRNIWAAVGFHPLHVARHDFDENKQMILARNPKVVAIGECGLDYLEIPIKGFSVTNKVKDKQRKVFEQALVLAQSLSKPIIIHCRDRQENYRTTDDLLSILKLHSPISGVMHCHRIGDWHYTNKILELGLHISFGGVITFNNELDEVVKKIPNNRILIETDTPFVSPSPYQGKSNEPIYLIQVLNRLSALRNVYPEEMAEVTFCNTMRLFNIEP